MPTAGWLWAGLCLWTAGLAYFLAAAVSALRSIAMYLQLMYELLDKDVER